MITTRRSMTYRQLLEVLDAANQQLAYVICHDGACNNQALSAVAAEVEDAAELIQPIIDNIGAIPEGPLGIYKPKLVYIELAEEEL